MDKNIQEFVNHPGFATDVFITKRKDDNRWAVSSKKGEMRFYIKIHAKEIRVRNDKTKECHDIPLVDIVQYLNTPFINILSLELKRRIYYGYNNRVYNNDVPHHFKSNNIIVQQYNECDGELNGDVVNYHDIAFTSPDKEGTYQIVTPQEMFEELLMRPWDDLSDLQKTLIGCYLDYNQEQAYDLFVENMSSNPALVRLKELYNDRTMRVSMHKSEKFVQIKFTDNKNISTVNFGISPSGNETYLFVGDYGSTSVIVNYMLSMKNKFWSHLSNRLYWLNEMMLRLDIGSTMDINVTNRR